MPVKLKERVLPFSSEHLEAIARVLADTDTGLTGSQIGHLLSECRIPDTTPDMTKWKRLYNALAEFQNKHQVGNHVVVFVTRAMSPASYTSDPGLFQSRRHELNAILAFSGMCLGDDGKVRRVERAATLDEALQRADRFRATLAQRKVHPDVLRYCNAEILARNYFHAIFEAMKSITAKIRELSGLTGDGAELVDHLPRAPETGWRSSVIIARANWPPLPRAAMEKEADCETETCLPARCVCPCRGARELLGGRAGRGACRGSGELADEGLLR